MRSLPSEKSVDWFSGWHGLVHSTLWIAGTVHNTGAVITVEEYIARNYSETGFRRTGLDDFTDALCRQIDPELFYPELNRSTPVLKAICVDCPVKNNCIGYAIAEKDLEGVHGGFSKSEKQKIIDAIKRRRPELWASTNSAESNSHIANIAAKVNTNDVEANYISDDNIDDEDLYLDKLSDKLFG